MNSVERPSVAFLMAKKRKHGSDDPSPEEIERRAAEIRKEWSERVERTRRGETHDPYEIPDVGTTLKRFGRPDHRPKDEQTDQH